MKYILIFLLGIAGLFLSGKHCKGQEVIATAGENFTAEERTLSWTIGEVVTETFGNESNLTQGFHQSKLTITSIYQFKDFNVEISAFPNPVLYELNLTINADEEEYTVTIFNDLGSAYYTNKHLLGTNPVLIDFNDYKQGVYFVRIINENGTLLKTFKIVKN